MTNLNWIFKKNLKFGPQGGVMQFATQFTPDWDNIEPRTEIKN